MTDARTPDPAAPHPTTAQSAWTCPLRQAPRRIQIARIGYDILAFGAALAVAFAGHPFLAGLVGAGAIVVTGLIWWRPYTAKMPREAAIAVRAAVVGGLAWMLGSGITALTQWAAAAGAWAGVRGVGYLTAVAGGMVGGVGAYGLLRYAVFRARN
jgi:hypothetical protein